MCPAGIDSDMLAGLCFTSASDLGPNTTSTLQMRKSRHGKVKCISGGAGLCQHASCSLSAVHHDPAACGPGPICLPWTHLPTTLCRCLSQLKLCNKNTRDGWRAQTADINCSEFWNLGSQRSRHQQIQCLVTSYCLIYKLPVPTVSLYLEGDRGSLGLSYKSTNPIMQAPPPSPHHFPKAIISGVRTST